jgi:hypothetical protein
MQPLRTSTRFPAIRDSVICLGETIDTIFKQVNALTNSASISPFYIDITWVHQFFTECAEGQGQI